MKNKRVSAVAALLSAFPLGANAVPIAYDVTYNATLGPNGVGSFFYDEAVGVITDFEWDFDGIRGGVGDAYDDGLIDGDTSGRAVFEILSQTDVHPGFDCNGCTLTTIAGLIDIGPAPFGANRFGFSAGFVGQEGPGYRFLKDFDTVARGAISITQAALPVPGPSTLSLLALALVAFGCTARSRWRPRCGLGAASV